MTTLTINQLICTVNITGNNAEGDQYKTFPIYLDY